MTAAVLAVTRQARTLVDGTLRVTLDIEPTDAQRAFAFLGSPTQLVGIAPVAKEAAQAPKPEAPKKTVELRKSVACAMRCNQKQFLEFLGVDDDAAEIVRRRLGVQSRAELDSNPQAGERWDRMEADFLAWSRGVR